MAKEWAKGEKAIYDGMTVTITSIEGLVCNLEDDEGRVYPGRMMSNLKTVPLSLERATAASSTPAPASGTASGGGVDLSGVEEAMNTPVGPGLESPVAVDEPTDQPPFDEASDPMASAYQETLEDTPVVGQKPSEQPATASELASKPQSENAIPTRSKERLESIRAKAFEKGEFPCPEPGCDDILDTRQKVGIHRRFTHGITKSKKGDQNFNQATKSPAVPLTGILPAETRTDAANETLISGDAERLQAMVNNLEAELKDKDRLVEAFELVLEHYIIK